MKWVTSRKCIPEEIDHGVEVWSMNGWPWKVENIPEHSLLSFLFFSSSGGFTYVSHMLGGCPPPSCAPSPVWPLTQMLREQPLLYKCQLRACSKVGGFFSLILIHNKQRQGILIWSYAHYVFFFLSEKTSNFYFKKAMTISPKL